MNHKSIREDEKVAITILGATNVFPEEPESSEKTIEFELNGKTYLAFYNGNDLGPGNDVAVTISILDSSNEESIDNVYGGNPSKGRYLEHDVHWSYFAFGQITSVKPTIADFGDFEFEIGLNADESKIGQFIFWYLGRMDIWPA